MTPYRNSATFIGRLRDAHPFEVFFPFLCILGGAPLLFDGPTPGTLQDALPKIMVTLWGVELVSGGFLTLIGVLLKNGWRIERFGLQLLGAAAGVYAFVLFAEAWPAAVALVAIVLGFGLTCAAVIRWRRTHVIVRVDPRSHRA